MHTSGGSLPVAMAVDELGALVDTLIENVFAHTPPGSSYVIEAEPAGEGFVRLLVADTGPGFDSAGAVARGTSGAGSTGLGLDIVRKAARRTGGEITVTSDDGMGARVEVLLGSQPPARGELQ